MRTDGLEKLKSLRQNLERQVSDYLRELDSVYAELRSEALAFLGDSSVKPVAQNPSSYRARISARATLRRISDISDAESKSHNLIVAETIDSFPSAFTVNDLIAALRPKISEDRLSNRAVGRSLSRIAIVDDSPIELVEKGMGSLPNVYLRKRLVVPDLEKIYEWHRQNDLRLRNEAHRNGA